MPDAHPATRRHPLHVHLTVLFSGLVLVTGALLAGLGYAGSRAIALAASETQFAGLARETGARLALALAPGARAVDLLAEHPVVAARGIAARLGALRSLAAAVEGQAFEAVYIGAPDGSFFLLRPLRDAARRTRFAAPESAAYLVDAIDAGGAAAQRIFLDAGLAEIGRRAREGGPYDPRTRPWYREARQAGQRRIVTAPYRFFSTGQAGVTVARRSAGGSVVALDVALDDLGRVLAEALPLPGARAVLFDGARRVLASSAGTPLDTDDGAGLPLLTTLADAALASLEPAAPGGSATRIDDAAGRTWQRMVVPVPTAREMLSLGMAIPLNELLAPARAVRNRTLAATLAVMLLALPLTYGLSRRVSRSLQTLGALADDIRAFRFDGAPTGRSPVLEVDQLAQAMDRMRARSGASSI